MAEVDYWSVTVSVNGDAIVTIEPRMLSGREIGPKEECAIRTGALHLLAFIGDGPPDFRSRIAALEAENEDIKDQLHYAKGTADVNIKGRLEAEAENGRLTVRLAEAERVLRFVAKHPHADVTNPRAIAHYFAAQPKDKESKG